jgi:hypothetical protein
MTSCRKIFTGWNEESERFRTLLRDQMKQRRDEGVKTLKRFKPDHEELRVRIKDLGT